MSHRRLHILQIFNRYLHYGGEEGSVARIREAVDAIHQVDPFHYSTSEIYGDGLFRKLNMAWKAIHNDDVAQRLMARHRKHPYDLWQIHNIFPAMSPVVYELALKWETPIVHYLHNYRLACVNGFFLNRGKPCQRCLSGNFWPAFDSACWRDNHLQSGLMGYVTNRIRQLPLFKKVFRWIAISEAQKREHVKMGIPEERIHVIPHFLRVTHPPLPPSANPTVIFIGRLSLEKGVGALLDAWKLVSGGNRKLIIMGDGPESANLEKKAKGLKGVEFLGFVKKEEQQKHWQESLFSVVPSIWIEPFGMTVLESWAFGRPVVAHAIGGLAEIIRDGRDGFLVQPNQVEDLAAKMDGLLANPKLAAAMGLAGYQRLKNDFSEQRWLKQISAVYEEVRSGEKAVEQPSKRPENSYCQLA